MVHLGNIDGVRSAKFTKKNSWDLTCVSFLIYDHDSFFFGPRRFARKLRRSLSSFTRDNEYLSLRSLGILYLWKYSKWSSRSSQTRGRDTGTTGTCCPERENYVLFTFKGHVAGTCNGECSRHKITTFTHINNERKIC